MTLSQFGINGARVDGCGREVDFSGQEYPGLGIADLRRHFPDACALTF